MTNIETIIEKFDENFGNLACYERITKCNCGQEEHELRQAISDIKSFLQTELSDLLEELVKEIEGERRMGGEFGFCEHCKLHKGDYEHDFGTCASYDKALSLAVDKIKKLIK